MPIIHPEIFKQEDLFIDAQLQATVDGREYDMTGRRYFFASLYDGENEQETDDTNSVEVTSAYNFRNNIGFGITNISVDISTSLQPIIEITFKDLYGHTAFGGNNPQNIDYSVLFNWPPPKFTFSYKGYLGRKVSYVLSVKKIDTNFVSQDGSYDIKVTFVPHQWGFFADIPYQWLTAVKALKEADGIKNSNDRIGRSIMDLLEVGNKVQQNTSQIRGEYEDIRGVLLDYKDNIVEAHKRNKGQIDGGSVENFISFETDVNFDGYASDGGVAGLDYALWANTKIYSNSDPEGPYFGTSPSEASGLDNDVRAGIRDRFFEVIEKNLKAVQKQIDKESFTENHKLLRKLTISEVFNQIASDSAYLMGKILEAGFRGQSNPMDDEINPTANRRQNRIEARKDGVISDVGYPMIIGGGLGDGSSEDVPARDRMGIEDAGCEMDFVRQFITALIGGVLEARNLDSTSELIKDEKITTPINNLEIISTNPYKPYGYRSFAQSILARSAIAGWFTVSGDINEPGGGNRASGVRELAESDFGNINQATLRGLSPDNKEELKQFCNFWNKLLSEDGLSFRNFSNENVLDLKDGHLKQHPGESVSSSILDFQVVLQNGSIPPEQLLTQEDISTAITSSENLGLEVKTVREMLGGLFGSGDLRTVSPNTMSGNRFIHNRRIYIKPKFVSIANKNNDYILVFTGDDAKSVKDKEGAVYFDSAFEGDQLADGLQLFNIRVGEGYAVDYNAIKNAQNFSDFQNNSFLESDEDWVEFLNQFRWTRQIGVNSALYNSSFGSNEDVYTPSDLPNSPIAFLPYYKEINYLSFSNNGNIPGTGVMPNNPWYQVAFDLWAGDTPASFSFNNVSFGAGDGTQSSQLQRIYLKKICSLIYNEINSLEDEERNIRQRIEGSAQEGEDSIYRQFKALYQQWNSLGFVENETPNGNGLADRMMREYGGSGSLGGDGVNLGNGNLPIQNASETDGVFVFDFPLKRILESEGREQVFGPETFRDYILPRLNVKNSLINTDVLFDVKSNATVLNVIQSICSKNNFIFIPIPGYANYTDINDIYSPSPASDPTKIVNFFHVMFLPTPESTERIKQGTFESDIEERRRDIGANAFEVRFGSTDNNIVKNVAVSTQDNKVTAESAINVQRLAESENKNRTVTRDCSILNVFAGRSYTASVDVLGNAQIFPMQFFYISNLPLFNGLYQILKVKHQITPNNFETNFEGIKMRFSPASGYGAVFPITLETLQEEFGIEAINESSQDDVAAYLEPDGDNVTALIETGDGQPDASVNAQNIIQEYNLTINPEA